MFSDPTVRHPVIKACTAWGCAGAANVADAAVSAPPNAWELIHAVPWGSLASIAAFVYTLALLSEWAWKRIIRPVALRFGWIKRRAVLTESEWAELRPRGK